MSNNDTNTTLHTPRRRSLIPQKNDVEITVSNSTASRFLGNQPKLWMKGSRIIDTPSTNPNSGEPIKSTCHNPVASETTTCPPRSLSLEPLAIQRQPSLSHDNAENQKDKRQEATLDLSLDVTEQPPKECNKQTSADQVTPSLPSPGTSNKPAISVDADIMKALTNCTSPSDEEAISPASLQQLATPSLDVDHRNHNELRTTNTADAQKAHNILRASGPGTSGDFSTCAGSDNHRSKRPRFDKEQEPSTTRSHGLPAVTLPSNENRISSTNMEPSSIFHSEILHPFNLRARIPALNQLQNQFGEYDQFHLQLLQDACASGDLVFLALHQIHCLNLTSPEMLLVVPKFGSVEKQGLQTVIHLWNRKMIHSSRFLELFDRFPAPFHLIMKQNNYIKALESVMSCLSMIGSTWPTFLNTIVARGYPPLIDELVELSVHSDVLQFVLFTSCCNRLRGSRPQTLLVDWKAIFQKNREYYRQRLAKLTTANPVTVAQMQRENESLVSLYKSILSVTPNRAAIPHASYPPVLLNTTASQLPIPQPSKTAVADKRGHSSTATQPRYTFNPHMTQTPLHGTSSFSTIPVNGVGSNSASLLPVTAQQGAPLQNTTVNFPVHRRPSPNSSTKIFPPAGFTPSEIANPNPLISGLHQSHLRVTTKPLSRQRNVRLFRYFHSFAILPCFLAPQIPIFQWHLMLSPEQFRKLPEKIPSGRQSSFVQGIVDGSLTYQMRCVKLNSTDKKITAEQWAVMDCNWPNAIYIHVNGEEHFVRRKFHHGKDMPLEISRSMKQGTNEIKLTLLRDSIEASKNYYAVAIEIIDSASPERVHGMTTTISAPESFNRIVKRLTNNTFEDDDELSIVDDHIAINLIDPFMSRIFDTPARSLSCSHNECFDLETFLSTRLSRAAKGIHGMAEDWKCPICSQDARPQTLIIDQFLVDVRAELGRRKQLDSVKVIEVKSGGIWKPRMHQREISTTSGEMATPKLGSQPPSAGRSAEKSPEIIELD